MRNFLHIFHYELSDLFHDPGILIFVLFVPLAYPLLYAWVYTNEVVRDVPVVVVDQCGSQRSRELVRKVDATPDVRVVERCRSLAEARSRVARREAYGVLLIPRGFDLDLAEGRQTTVWLYCDMSSMLYYKGLLLAATDVSLEMNRDIKVAQYVANVSRRDTEVGRMPVEYDHVRLYNPSGGFASFLIPPVLMLILQQTLLLGVGMQMGRTRERNMGCAVPMQRFYKHPLAIVGGKTAVYLGLYTVMGVYAFVFVSRWFGLPQLGDYGVFLCFLVPFLLACIFFAMTLSSLIYRREDCILIFVFLSVPLLFLSGISWPVSAMPPAWKVVSYLFPSTFGLRTYVRIASMGCPLQELGADYVALWVQVGVYGLTAMLMYRRHLRQMVARWGLRGRKKRKA